MICLSIIDRLQTYVHSATTAKEAWTSLCTRYEDKSLTKIIQLRGQLYSIRMSRGANMTEHCNKLRLLADQLQAIDDPVADKDLAIILLSSLPSDYGNLVTAINVLGIDELTWEKVRDRAISEKN